MGVYVGPVVVEQIALNCRFTWTGKECVFIGPAVRIIALRMRGGAEMPLLRGLKRREVGTELFFVGAAISPVGAPSFPKRPQAFLVGDGILDDQSLNPFRMRHRQPEPDRPANSHGEPIHDGSQMIEGVGEGLR